MIVNCFQFGDCIGTLVEEYVVLSSVYALIDYVILFFKYGSRLIILWPIKIIGSRLTILWTIYSPEYGQPGTINLYGPEYDQPVFVWEENPGGLFHVLQTKTIGPMALDLSFI